MSDAITAAPDEVAVARAGPVAWWTVIVLSLSSCVSFIDRTLINLLVEPIKADLVLSDTEIGMIQGLAFAVFYTTLGLPIGWMADRWPRKWIILTGGAIWCLMTAASGLARSFTHLFIARAGVGAGEATLSPCAVAMIGDLFPPERRPLAIGVFQTATTLGGGLALILGGLVISLISGMSNFRLPLFGPLAAWQAAFFVVGLGGFALILLILTVPEPLRRAAPEGVTARATLVQSLRSDWSFFAPFLGGCALHTAIAYGVFSWAPTVFIRRFEWEAGEVGLRYGFVFLIFAGAGPIVGGWLAGVMQRRGLRASSVKVSTLGMVCAAPLVSLGAMAPNADMALVFFALGLFFLAFPGGALLSAMQEAAPTDVRARAVALYYLVVSVVGLSVGPLMSGVLMDYVFRDPAAVGQALACMAMSLWPVAVVLTGLSLRSPRAT